MRNATRTIYKRFLKYLDYVQEKDLTTKEPGRISEDIANRKYRIATASKKMIDTLWWAENEKNTTF